MIRAKLVGEKIYLRPLEKSDLDGGWHDWINDSTINTNLISPFPVNRVSLERYFDGSQGNDTVMFAICDKETDDYIGNARLSAIDWVHRTALYGRLLGQTRGRGYGTDALIQLLRFGFHYIGLNRIWSTCFIENTISLRSNEKVGMVREGIMRQAVFKDGAFHDTVILAMTRDDFDRKHGGPEAWAAKTKQQQADE